MPHVKSRVVARRTARKVPWKAQRNRTQSPVENPRLSQAAVENSHALPAKNPVFVVIVEVTGTGC